MEESEKYDKDENIDEHNQESDNEDNDNENVCVIFSVLALDHPSHKINFILLVLGTFIKKSSSS